MSTHIRFDWAIKRLLRQKSNFVILEGFLSELLPEDVFISEILESESNKENEKDKYNRVDILVKNSKKELILIEVQNDRERDYFHRMNYGQAKLLVENLHEKEPYENIKKIYSINIVYFELGQGSDYVYQGKTEFRGIHTNDLLQLNTNQKKVYPINHVSDIFTTYYILKINKFDDIAKSTLDEWIYFLKNNEIKDDFKAKGLKEAKEKLRVDNLSKKDKELYNTFIKNRRILENEILTAKQDGYIEAEKKYGALLNEAQKREEKERIEKEEAQKKVIEGVKEMIKQHVPIENIAKFSGLSVDEIEKLK